MEFPDLSLGDLSKPLRGGKMQPGIHVQWSLHHKNQTALPPLLVDIKNHNKKNPDCKHTLN